MHSSILINIFLYLMKLIEKKPRVVIFTVAKRNDKYAAGLDTFGLIVRQSVQQGTD